MSDKILMQTNDSRNEEKKREREKKGEEEKGEDKRINLPGLIDQRPSCVKFDFLSSFFSLSLSL